MDIKRYTEGLDMNQFRRISEISVYNHNYYIGLDNDLLFALSNDDNTTEWWLIVGINAYYLGESYVSEGDKLNRYETRCT